MVLSVLAVFAAVGLVLVVLGMFAMLGLELIVAVRTRWVSYRATNSITGRRAAETIRINTAK